MKVQDVADGGGLSSYFMVAIPELSANVKISCLRRDEGNSELNFIFEGRMARSQGNGLRWIILLAVVGVLLGRFAGYWLVVDAPQKADLIIVLAGETEQRPARGLQLLEQGFAPRMLLDVPAAAHIYHQAQMEIARQYLSSLPRAAELAPCPIAGLSTRDEVHDVATCLASANPASPNAGSPNSGSAGLGQAKVTRILLVTSDFHTRRALTIFRHEMPGVEFSVAAAYDPVTYGPKWWQQREWAKTFSGEIVKMLWWYGVDRWRG